jgi:rod shape-determining protein MreB
VPVYLAEDPISCVALGTGKVLDYMDKLDSSFNGGDIYLAD